MSAGEGTSSTEDADSDTTVPRGGTPIALGAGLGIDDFDAVAALGGVCDRLGIDVISAGNAVAWAVRASDAGLIDPVDHASIAISRSATRRPPES
ncbi:aldehyde ferredoxin oxidoreductase C-terminal domain-containing protein [Halorubrum saccharovorum]|uniref:aldehyde ferredoxin oxidoreductase C-terminal domain-containing protein n=1 Tax=Halorubrum saccharovorum TaxID=2248 RepID=UPI002285E2E9|nr:aldehyde ferredoxin oxidoreductase C-terminal domain-containing protein [Halorubrum saccharovorum]